MAINMYSSIINIDVNGLMLQAEDLGQLNGQENPAHTHAVYKRPSSGWKAHRD